MREKQGRPFKVTFREHLIIPRTFDAADGPKYAAVKTIINPGTALPSRLWLLALSTYPLADVIRTREDRPYFTAT